MHHPESLKRHIYHLEDRHKTLESELTILEQHHQNDTPVAQMLKKKKLIIKDELTRCRQALEGMLQ